MTEYKQVDEKPVWLIVKRWQGGLIEFVGTYWRKETAEKVVVNNLPNISDNYAITMTEVTLHGSMVISK